MDKINLREIESLKSKSDIPHDFDTKVQNSIENGYFIFTMMPSLRCKLRCPHCYLSLEQRTTSPVMSNEKMRLAFEKVDSYYQKKNIKRKVIVFYWYGGEPTQAGQDYMLKAFKDAEEVFTEEKGYYIRHEILTALIGVDSSWYPIFYKYGRGHIQSSFDGIMRGERYMVQWDRNVRKAMEYGLELSTISVVNFRMVEEGAKNILNYLTDLGVKEASFLPFMLNEQNYGKKYDELAPRMDVYSDFMIELQDHWYELKEKGKNPPFIGQMSFIDSRRKLSNGNPTVNMPAQTLFMLPEGEMVLPDYKDGYVEYMNEFGNILEQDFESILKSKNRRAYMRRQVSGNLNPECLECEYKDCCIMEFWKPNRVNDECFGAKRYVEHVLAKEAEKGFLESSTPLMF